MGSLGGNKSGEAVDDTQVMWVVLTWIAAMGEG